MLYVFKNNSQARLALFRKTAPHKVSVSKWGRVKPLFLHQKSILFTLLSYAPLTQFSLI